MKKGKQLVSVTAFIPWQGKALLVKRARHDNFLPGYWEQIGGDVDFEENPYDALVREVREESGLIIKPGRPYFVASYMDENDAHCVEIAFHCELSSSPDVVLSDEHEDKRWVAKDELATLSPMSDFMRTMILKGFESYVRHAPGHVGY